MPNIALVEDEPEAADVLASFIARYAGEKGLELTVTRFGNAMDFEMTHQHFDLVFDRLQAVTAIAQQHHAALVPVQKLLQRQLA